MTPDLPTRDLILDAAERAFARLGFAAATIKAIGAEAGVNTALLYYYFADKETLYRAVLARLIDGLVRGGAARLADTAAGPEATLRALVEFQAEYLLAHPNAPRLIGRELIDHQAAHAVEQIQHVSANLFDRVCALIERGQESGVFRFDVEPRFAAISTVAQNVYFAIAGPAVAIMLHEPPGGPSPDTVRAFARHAADFALAALRAPGAPVAGAGDGAGKRSATSKRPARARARRNAP